MYRNFIKNVIRWVKIVKRVTIGRFRKGFTNQYLTSRFSSHRKPSQAVGKHLRNCGALNEVSVEDIEILAQSHRGTEYLMTLEALW